MGKRKNKKNMVEEVQMENNVKSYRELTPAQKEDLNKMIDMIDKEVDETEHIIKKVKSLKEKFRLFIESGNGLKRIAQAGAVLAFLLIMVVYTSYIAEMTKFNKEYNNSICESTQTKIKLYIDDNDKLLNCDVNSVSVSGNNGKYNEIKDFSWVTSDIDTNYDKYDIDGRECELGKETRLNSLIVCDSYMYMEFANSNKNANKEIIFSSSKPLDINLSGLSKKTLRFFEKSNPVMVKGYVNSFNDSFLMLSETIGGGELNISTIQDKIQLIENNIRISDNKSGFLLEINGVGSLDLSKLTFVSDSPQVIYKLDDGVLRINNKVTNSDYLYVYSIHDNNMGLNPEDLLETSLENVFIHKQFDDEGNNGYCTFAIIGDNNIYCFKAVNKDVVLEVLEQLGLDSNQLSINKIQSVIKTQ